jgi:HSP20 family protein
MWTTVNDIDRMLGAMDLLRSRLSRLSPDFRIYGKDYGWDAVANAMPRTNFYEARDYLEIKAEVPGLAREDLSIKIQGNYLEISGTRKGDAPEGYKAHRIERKAPTSFTRSFTLPSDVNVDKVEATLNNGLLTLTLPKAEAAKPKQIMVS